MSRKDSYYSNLIDSVQIVAEIKCSRCNNTGTIGDRDEFDAALFFFDKGWRGTSQNCYCPKCAHKYLKLTTTNPYK